MSQSKYQQTQNHSGLYYNKGKGLKRQYLIYYLEEPTRYSFDRTTHSLNDLTLTNNVIRNSIEIHTDLNSYYKPMTLKVANIQKTKGLCQREHHKHRITSPREIPEIIRHRNNLRRRQTQTQRHLEEHKREKTHLINDSPNAQR